MKILMGFLICMIVAAAYGSILKAKDKIPITITILYDNYEFKPGLRSDWGFSCKIEGMPRTILFDTGTQADILFSNIEKLDVSISDIDTVVISHNHGDHTGGLFPFLKKNHDVSVYLVQSFPDKFVRRVEKTRAHAVVVADPVQICAGVYLTGEMGGRIPEQSLILDTPRGLVVITGCSHPGIVDICKKAREILKKDIFMVFGGFHLRSHSESQVKEIITQFRELGVKKCGPTHCTGDRAIQMFKEAYGEDYLQMGVGRVVRLHF